MPPHDRLGELRNAGNITEQGTSPWSEYRRLILAELERINSLAEGLRAEAHRQQTQLVLLQDQMAQCSRSIELIRERMEALNRRLSEEPSFHSKRQKSLLVSIPSENGIVKAVIVALLAMIFALATGQIAPLLGLIR